MTHCGHFKIQNPPKTNTAAHTNVFINGTFGHALNSIPSAPTSFCPHFLTFLLSYSSRFGISTDSRLSYQLGLCAWVFVQKQRQTDFFISKKWRYWRDFRLQDTLFAEHMDVLKVIILARLLRYPKYLILLDFECIYNPYMNISFLYLLLKTSISLPCIICNYFMLWGKTIIRVWTIFILINYRK